MNLLFLSQVVPYPLDAGPKVRAYYVLRQLAQTHAVTLACFSRPDDDPAALAHLRTWCRAVHTVPLERGRRRDALALASSFLRRQPFLVRRDGRPAMHALIARLCAATPFDSLHADQLPMAQFALRAPLRRKVLDEHNAVWHVVRRVAQLEPSRWRRAILGREWRALRAYEGVTCRAFDRVVAVSEPDRLRLAQAGAGPNIEVIPICLDVESLPRLEREPAGPGRERERERVRVREVTYIGSMHWPPNAEGIRWFVRQVWPRIAAAAPDARLNILGKQPPADLCAARSGTVRVHGYVADPAPFLARTAVSVVPLRSAGGVRVKILESWALGVPIVSTTIGAEGLEARPGDNLLLADTPDDFARAVVALLGDPERAEQLAASGRRLVGERYDWRRVYGRFSELHAAGAARTALL